MGVRHYFVIHYIPDTDRKVITITERIDYDDQEFDLASRREFEWWTFTQEEIDADSTIFDRPNQRKDKEAEAASYARELSARHNLTFRGQSNEDGILD